jgi:thiamine pyrophosphate-dependent acetolactate synthase large subunit-like protein
MKVVDAVAHILKAEGVEFLFAFPVNHLIEAAAKLDIRTIIVRQERTGLHMADAVSRLSSGQKIGVFGMQHGPGTENAFGGVAQAYGESSPILVLPMGFSRTEAQVEPNFDPNLNFRHVTKSIESLTLPHMVSPAMRRAFNAVRTGRPQPAMVVMPTDLLNEELPEPLDYTPARTIRSGPDPDDVKRAVDLLVEAEHPVIYAGQGIHYAQAWDELVQLAEKLQIPVTTTLTGKSAFPEDHPLALGCANRSQPKAVMTFLRDSDLIFGIGCSFTFTPFGIRMPAGKRIMHATLDSKDVNKDVASDLALIGDAKLTLRAILDELDSRKAGLSQGESPQAAIAAVKEEWLADWMPKLTSDESPLNPYRVIWDLMHTVDLDETIITHDAGGPRDQLAPFWQATKPLSYLGWGKTTQLGYGLGLTMGAKLAHPEKLCINVWGDAAIGFTGMDFETAVRERIPILSILLNNFSMACEIGIMQVSTEKYGSTNITGNYAGMAEAFGGYGERVTKPEDIIPSIHRGIEQTRAGKPALLEFITSKETAVSVY